jgi:hypothetical protein
MSVVGLLVIKPMSQMGQNAKYSSGADVFRSTAESGLNSDIAP